MTASPLSQIRDFTKRRRFELLSRRATAVSVTILLAYLTVSAFLWTAFSFFPWTALPVLWTVATLLLLIILLFLPLFLVISRPTLVKTAAIIERGCDIKHPALSLALELSQEDDIGGSQSLKEHTYLRAASQLEPIGAARLPSVNRFVLIMTAIMFVVNVSLNMLSPNKLINYWKLPFALISGERARVEPGRAIVPLNSSVTLTLSGAARHYPTARLETWSLGAPNRDRRFLRADSVGNFSQQFDSIKESFVYQFSLSSPLPPDTVTVVLPPLLRSLKISLTPPRHTKLPPRDLPAGLGNISAYAGTRVDVSLESGALGKAGIIFNEFDTVLFNTKGTTATGMFIAEKPAEYTLLLMDTLGQFSESPPQFMISILPDVAPIARILKPGENKMLSASQAETLWVEGIDDFGIGKMELKWRHGVEPAPDGYDLSEKGAPQLIRKPVVWNIRELALYPGDTLYYWLLVRDNKPFGKAQTAVSDTFWFRVPSFEEIHKSIVQKEQYAQDKLGEVRRRQDNISGAVEKFVRSAAGAKELSWDQQRVIDDVKEQIKAQADSLQKAFEALEEGMRALREDGKLNDELLSKMERIKKSVEELMKEFGEKLFNIDKDSQPSMNDMKQAASKLKDMLPELSERLDQTLAFLEKIRQEKELADLATRAENLSDEQADITASGDNLQNEKRQRDLLDRIDDFNNDARDFFKQRGDEPPPSLQTVQELSNRMKQQGGKEGKNAMGRELRSLSEQLKSKLSVNMMAKMEEDRKRILSMAYDAISLEEWQRIIQFQAHGTADDRGVAFAQQALGNAIRVSLAKTDSLSMVGSDVIREIVRAYRNAATKSATVIAALDKTDGTRQMEQSLQTLRELANLLLSITGGDDGNSDGGGAGGGMMQGLRRASGRQAALNSMMGEMLQTLLGGGQRPQGQGRGGYGQQDGDGQSGDGADGERASGNSTGGGAESMERKKAKEAQNAIAEELKRLADAYGKESGENMEKRVRELEQEARRLAQLLENPPTDIIDQQDKFLSRMLQSTLSLNRKDEGKEERKGVASQTIFSSSGNSPQSMGIPSKADSFHLLRKRAFEDNFPEEYRSAIREYFDVLGEMKWKE